MSEIINKSEKSKVSAAHWTGAYFTALCLIAAFSFVKIFVLDGIGLKDFNIYAHFASAFVYAVLLFGVFSFVRLQNSAAINTKRVWAICSIIVLCYAICLACSLLDLSSMPLLLTAILICSLIDAKIGFVANLALNLMVLWTLAIQFRNNQQEYIFSLLSVLIIGTLGTALIASRIADSIKRLNYLFTLIWVGVITFSALAASEFLYEMSLERALELLPYFLIGIGIQVLLSVLLQPILEYLFNLITNTRLVELTDYRQPLLVRLHKEAPGTFNHSLTVANLAETCATAIGVNPYMAKAAAFYHDVGKLKNVGFFSENQDSDYNPHDDLMPEISRDIIISHTTAGLAMCREYHIPPEIAAITVEHHGTLPITVFYNKAKQLTDGEVDVEKYKYTNPLPSTKVAALIMICDCCEAAIRSINRPTGQKVDSVVKTLINYRLFSGQFDNCDITMQDLHIIRKTIVDAFGGLYHNRVSYDKK